MKYNLIKIFNIKYSPKYVAPYMKPFARHTFVTKRTTAVIILLKHFQCHPPRPRRSWLPQILLFYCLRIPSWEK